MSKIAVKNQVAEVVAEREAPVSIFSVPFKESVVYEAVKNSLANKRHGNAHTKTISEVAGSTKKPWRQKGSGRARAGTKKSPLWRGGGVSHGPRKRGYRYSLPKQVRRKALLVVLSQLRREARLHLLKDFSLEKRSSKKAALIFSGLLAEKNYPKNKKTGLSVPLRVLYVLPQKRGGDSSRRELLRDSIANLSWLKAVSVDALEIKELFYAKEVIFSESAFDALVQLYSRLLKPRLHTAVSSSAPLAGREMGQENPSVQSKQPPSEEK